MFYKHARAKFDSSEAFQARARNRVVLLQSGDPETLRLWKMLVDLSMGHFDRLYRKIGVLLTDADLAGESMYNDLLAGSRRTAARRPGCCRKATAPMSSSLLGTPTAKASRFR